MISYYLLLILSFCLPLNKKVLPYIIICIILNWFIRWNFRLNFIPIFKSKNILLFISFFLLYVVGILYSHDLNYAADDILLKLSLFIFPIVLFISSEYSFDKIKSILLAFISGCFVACIGCLIHSTISYYQTHDLIAFFYGNLSIIHHPGYFSMYLTFVNSLLIFHTFLKQSRPSTRNIFLLSILIVFFSLFIILLNSKTGIFSSLWIFFISLIYFFIGNKRYLMLIGSMLSILLFFLLIYHFFINPVNPRFAKPQEMFQNKSEVIDKTTTESSSVRVLIWQAATEIIKDNFIFGVGTGDVKDVLLEKYKEQGMTGAYKEKLNAHNQFLQTFIALGLPGITLLLSSFIFPIVLAFKKKNFIYISFLVIVFINFLTESMLETIAGVLFYAFFNSLLMVNINRKELSLIKD